MNEITNIQHLKLAMECFQMMSFLVTTDANFQVNQDWPTCLGHSQCAQWNNNDNKLEIYELELKTVYPQIWSKQTPVPHQSDSLDPPLLSFASTRNQRELESKLISEIPLLCTARTFHHSIVRQPKLVFLTGWRIGFPVTGFPDLCGSCGGHSLRWSHNWTLSFSSIHCLYNRMTW